MTVEDRVQVKELVDLAHDKSERGRKLLVENITDLFLSPEGRLNDHERALMSDILCKLIESIESSIRAQLAERLASIEDAPPELIRQLAQDEISIARPILERSKVLRDPDLIEIIKERTKEHRLSIALREQVSRDVSDALIEYGDEDVIETLLKNADAELSERAMEYLVSESRRVDRFQEPLVHHSDLDPKLAYRMFWWVSAALRHHIVTHYEADELQLDQAIEDAARQAMEEHDPESAVASRAQRLVHRLLQQGELNIPFLIQALRQHRLPVFAAGFAELANISHRMVMRIITDPGGESVAILCKAIGVERSDFTTIFLLLEQAQEGGRPVDPGTLNRSLKLFDRIERSNAEAVLGYWRRDAGFLAAMDDVEKTGA